MNEPLASADQAADAAVDAAGPALPAGPPEARHGLMKALRNGFKLGGSLMFTWSIALGIRVIIPRHLGPERFGLLTFADTFSATFALALSLGVDTYIRKEVSVRAEHASDFFGGVALLRVGIQLLLFGAVLGSLYLTHRPHEVMLAAAIFSFARMFETFNGTLSAMLHAKSEVDGAAVLAVATKVIWAGGILLAVHYDTRLWAYALSFLASEGVETFVLYALSQKHLGLRLRVDRVGTRGALHGSLPFYMITVAQGVYSRLDITILAFFASSRDVGLYNAAFTVGGLTMLMAPLFSWVITPVLSRAAHSSEEELGAMLMLVLEGLAITAVPLSLAAALGADLTVYLLFGPTFQQSVRSMHVLGAMYAATYAGMALGAALSVSDRGWVVTRVMLIGVAVDIALNLALIPLALHLGGPDNGSAGIACATSVTISEVVVMVLLARPLRHLLPMARIRWLLLRNAAVVAVVVTAHYFMRPLGYPRLAIDLVIYLAAAAAAGLLQPRKLARMGRDLLKRPAAA